jgi:hypothetical protein
MLYQAELATSDTTHVVLYGLEGAAVGVHVGRTDGVHDKLVEIGVGLTVGHTDGNLELLVVPTLVGCNVFNNILGVGVGASLGSIVGRALGTCVTT